MKILKPGKVEMRKFVCPNCECEFVIYKSEADRAIDMEANYHYWAKCLCRDQIAWEKGEPYGEPKSTQADVEQTDIARLKRLMKLWNFWSNGTGGLEQYLIENGVTFREG